MVYKFEQKSTTACKHARGEERRSELGERRDEWVVWRNMLGCRGLSAKGEARKRAVGIDTRRGTRR